MRQPRAKRPSPALIISLIALFVAVGGSAYAAKKIGTKEIRKNAVTTAKIRKNAVTTAKIRKNAVNGAKVKESSLGPVPKATNATNATNAANAVNAVNAVNAASFSRFHTSGLKKASPGQTVALLVVGPFTIVGKCVDKGGGELEAQSFIATAQPGSGLYGYTSSYDEGNFNPGIVAELSDEAQGTNTYVEWSSNSGQYTGFRAASADGQTILEGESVNAVFYAGSPCAYWVSATNVA